MLIKRISIKFILALMLFSLLWLVLNNLKLSSEEGYDPLRYYYLTINNIRTFDLNPSYFILFLFRSINLFQPFYLSYITFIIILSLLITRNVNGEFSKIVLLSPITLYYLSQTGKDGLTILALFLFVLLVITKKIKLIPIALILLVLFIRQSAALYLIILYIQLTYSNKAAVTTSVLIGIGFVIFTDTSSRDFLQYLTEIDGGLAGSNKIRSIGFGYNLKAILVRILLYISSILFQPLYQIISSIKFGISYTWIQASAIVYHIYVLFRLKTFVRFNRLILPYAIILGFTTPFYHFRYIFLLYPLILLISNFDNEYNLRKNLRWIR